jgi:hypothetical protein
MSLVCFACTVSLARSEQQLAKMVICFILCLCRMYENQQHIESIVREMLKSLCTVSIAFSVELRLQGTLGITVDRNNIHLIQLDERILSNTSNDVHVVPADLVIPESIVKVERDDPAYQFGHMTVSESPNSRHHVVAPIDNQPSQTCQTIAHASQGQCGTSNVRADCSVIRSLVADSDSRQLAGIPQPASLNSAVSTERSKSSSQDVNKTNVCQLPHDPQLSKYAVVKLKRLDANKLLANGCGSLGITIESNKNRKSSRVRLLKNDEYVYESPCTPREVRPSKNYY